MIFCTPSPGPSKSPFTTWSRFSFDFHRTLVNSTSSASDASGSPSPARPLKFGWPVALLTSVADECLCSWFGKNTGAGRSASICDGVVPVFAILLSPYPWVEFESLTESV
jgi:hypothetical protein